MTAAASKISSLASVDFGGQIVYIWHKRLVLPRVKQDTILARTYFRSKSQTAEAQYGGFALEILVRNSIVVLNQGSLAIPGPTLGRSDQTPSGKNHHRESHGTSTVDASINNLSI